MNYSEIFTVKGLARKSDIDYQRLIFNLSAMPEKVRLTDKERDSLIQCIGEAFDHLKKHLGKN